MSKKVSLRVGSIFRHPEHGIIYITDGQLESNGRVSNFWTANKTTESGILGEEVSFYGEPCVCLDKKYDVITYVLKR